MFWSYTGVLTSISAVNSISVPVKSLDDFRKMNTFELYIAGGGSTQTLLQKWAKSDNWKLNAYKQFVKTGLEDDSKIKEIIDEMLIEGGGSNTALFLDKERIPSLLKQCKFNFKLIIFVTKYIPMCT